MGQVCNVIQENGRGSGGGVAESVVGTVENGTTASQPYAVGEHFIRNDKFCTAIAAIASGATLTQGTNYVEGTIAECVARMGTYSTTETEIGTWLGKRLYRRVFEIASLPNNSLQQIPVDLSSFYNIRIYGFANDKNMTANSTSAIPLPYLFIGGGSTNYSVEIFYSTGSSAQHRGLYIRTMSDYSSKKGYIIAEYTKNS